ncbi:acyl-CoA dehydrogenase [Parahaliea maris]|uniref:Acyl-CoA dehydrogenase n=1 Tax=Parahaliea maris TaxID=2716870 RepID=A0A5C8ZQ68_9GAMM|nr:acyl-CoA dehydrogenase family protein [Parahaliea maris]TXS89832.1 acyl-CoA dehydrogenase [Parahaliea maris]
MIPWPQRQTLPASAEALRDEVRDFLAAHPPAPAADIRARSWMGFDADFSRALGQRGWVGLSLPREYGGAGGSAFERFVVLEELLAAGAPVSAHWIADRQSAPLLLRYGSESLRQELLPRICAGEVYFCIGMSEPGAGSDLASVSTRATRNDQGWLLNGSKLWTTNADRCHYMIALVRTSGQHGDRQQGLSQMLVDLSLPGITVRPIRDLAGDAHFNEVFFDNVQLTEEALIGAEGDGWQQVTAELAFERSGPERIMSSIALLECWCAWLRRSGGGSADRRALGELASRLAVLRSMSLAITAQLEQGESPVIPAALVKDLGTGFEQDIPDTLADVIGRHDDAFADEELMRTLAYTAMVCPIYSLRGGTREILRGLIARGMGLR